MRLQNETYMRCSVCGLQANGVDDVAGYNYTDYGLRCDKCGWNWEEWHFDLKYGR